MTLSISGYLHRYIHPVHFFLFLDKSHIKEEVFHNGFFSLILPRKAISGKNCQRVLVDLVYYMVVQDVV